MNANTPLRSRRTVKIIVSLAAGALLAGCTTVSTSASGSGTGAATSASAAGYTLPAAGQQTLDAAMKAPTWQGPTSSPKPAKNKLVIDIPCAQSAVGCARPGNGFLAAAKEMGWRTQMIDPEGDPQKVQAAVQQAIQLHASAAFLPGGAIATVGASLMAKARAADVQMVTMGGFDQTVSPATWSVNVSNDYSETSPALAAYVTAHSDGKAQVLMINDSEYPEVDSGYNAFKSKLAAWCPGCAVAAQLNLSIVNLQTTFPAQVQSVLQAHPSINYIYVGYDFIGTQVITAVDQLGLSGKVHLVGADGNPQNLEAVKQGNVETASYARGTDAIGWVAVDELNRIFNNQPLVKDANGLESENFPQQLTDSTNLPADVAANWDGGLDYQAYYEKLWGLS
jgi:ribose transport system substrate-binding protein